VADVQVRGCAFCLGKVRIDTGNEKRPLVQHSKPSCKTFKKSRDAYAFLAKLTKFDEAAKKTAAESEVK